VLTLHHLLVDGWSMPLVVGRLLEAYDRRTVPGGRPELRSAYTDYLSWVSRQDVEVGRAAWSDHLDGLTRPTVVAGGTGVEAGPSGSHRVRCTDEVTARLTALAHRHAATLSTVVLVAWAAVLARLSGRSDVVFGLVVSTRPPELPGVDRAVGLMLNTVPVRVRAGAGDDVGAVLRRTQHEQLALTPFRHLGAAEIFASCPELRDGGDPYDTVVVIENFPFESNQGRQPAGLRLGGTTVVDSRHHPVSLVVEPGAGRLSLRLDAGAGLGGAGLIGEMGAHLEEALGQLADGLLPPVLAEEPTTSSERVPSPVAEPGPTSRRTASTPLEAAVARAFASVLGLGEEPVDVDTSFFALGGDSIAAIRLAGLLRGQGLRVGPRDVFESRTPAAIAAAAGTDAVPAGDVTDLDDPFYELLDDPFALTLDELAELDEELGFGGAPR
jgi:non-ribosomal peptide synthetase component F